MLDYGYSTAHLTFLFLQSFSFHIGADLPIPTADKRKTHTVDAPAQSEASSTADPFAGLPLQAWAERLGERIMPAYELVKEEQMKAKLATKQTQPKEVQIPAIPTPFPSLAGEQLSNFVSHQTACTRN